MGLKRVHRSWRHRPAAASAAAAALALLVTACGSGGTGQGPAAGGAAPVKGGTASFAEPPSAIPDWILPIGTAGHLASYNSAIQSELFLPLVKYDNSSGKLAVDKRASALGNVSYSNGDKTVTVTLAKRSWSDGKPVTSRDVQFWFNLIRANKANWAGYVKGQLPDNVATFTIVNSTTFRLGLTHPVNPTWFTANELTQITPLPRQAWDVESSGGKAGNYDETTAGAKKVFSYLVTQAKNIASYDTSPLWKVTDGPFKLGSWTTSGSVTLDKSTTYHGPDPAHLASVSLKPFTSAAAEFNMLRAGGLDYGYVPPSDLSQVKFLKSNGYRIAAWDGWAINYAPYNFNNPTLGPAFKQLYIRQAIQMGINQAAIVKNVWHGQATPVYGPVPQHPASPFLSKTQASNPYPYNPAKAKQLLESHGWTPNSQGLMTCTSPGSGPHQCGQGVKRGTVLNLHMLSESGSIETRDQMQAIQTQLAKIGVGFQIRYTPLNTVLSNTAQCTSTSPSCTWQLSFFGTQGSWYFNAYPSGAEIFASNGGSNFGSYSNAKADQLAAATRTGPSTAAMRAWSAYLAKQLPVMWLPLPSYQISAIKKTLGGVTQDPLAGQTMQRWFLRK